MAENKRRPDYSPEYSSESYESKPKESPDPLAELARLIGQDDPFADAGRAGARKPLDGLGADDRPAPEWLARSASAQERDENEYEAPRAAARYDDAAGHRAEDDAHYDHPAHDPHAGDAAHDGRYASAHDHAPAQHIADDRADYADHDSVPYRGEAYQLDDRYRVTPPPPADYDDPYYDGHMPPQGEEGVSNRRRGGILTIAAVLGLAVIGTAGAFGYRAFTGSSAPATPPVIKADTAPAKIVPPTNADAASKPFQERVGSAPAAERVVSREEQPVSLPVAPTRPSAPASAQAAPGPAASGEAALAAPAPLMAPAPSLPGGAANEPKRVRTMTIRPDSAGGETTSTAAAPPSSSAAASRTPAAKQQTGSSPLTIAPPSEPASRTKVASRPAPAAVAPSGAYVVQVSAQKSENEAQSSYRALQAKYPAVLGGRDANIRRADLGGSGVWYRAQVGPFASASQAEEFCGRLKTAGGQCIVQKN